MTEAKLRLVTVSIEASDRHCSNDCNWVEFPMNGGASCKLFEAMLEWDKRKKENGYKRHVRCRGAEVESIT